MSTSAVFPPLPLPIYLSPMSDVSTSSRITSSSRTSSSRSSTRSATSTSTRFPTSTSNGSLSSNPFDFFKTPGALPGIIVGAVVLIGILAALTRRQIRRRNAAAYTTATLFPSTNSTNYYPPLPQQSYLAHNSNPNPYAPDHYPTAQTPNSSPYMSGVGPAASFTPPPSQSAYNQNVGSGWAPPLEPIYHHPQPCLRTSSGSETTSVYTQTQTQTQSASLYRPSLRPSSSASRPPSQHGSAASPPPATTPPFKLPQPPPQQQQQQQFFYGGGDGKTVLGWGSQPSPGARPISGAGPSSSGSGPAQSEIGGMPSDAPPSYEQQLRE